MEKDLQKEITQRFVNAVDTLKKKGIIARDKELCNKIGIPGQSLSDMRAMRRAVTIEILYNTCFTYSINANFILLGIGELEIAPNIASKIAPNYKNLNETIHLAAEEPHTYITSRIKELEQEVLRLEAQNEAYLNAIRAIGGDKESNNSNTA